MQNIKDTWTYNHKLLILTLSFAVVILIQAFPITLPTNSVEAYGLRPTPEQVSFEALHKQYTEEEYAKMYLEAELRATTRLFEELGEKTLTLNPYKK